MSGNRLNSNDAKLRFDAVVWPHAAMVLRTARMLIRDPAAADDVAQETLVKAFRRLDSFQDGTDIKAWLLTILRHARIDYFRRREAQGQDVSLDALVQDPPDMHQEVDHRAIWSNPTELLQQFSDHAIIEAIKRLPEDIRWTLLLVDIEGMDHADAAAVMGVPVGTVKSRAHRGRAMLRSELLPAAVAIGVVKKEQPSPAATEMSS